MNNPVYVNAKKVNQLISGAFPVLSLWALVVWLYFDTFASLFAIWVRSDTFAHGMLIPLISMYLVYRKRDQLQLMPNHPSWVWLIPIVFALIVFVVSVMARVLVVEQYSIVLVMVLIVFAVAGTHKAKIILFPLLFLFFMVPSGEFLINPLMEYTATFTVWAVRAVGVPVFRDGMYFSTPTGNFEVAAACSGIRYLIASIALGSLFAYLNFTSNKKRFLFVLFAMILPIIANGVRAFGIVMIAHWSNLKYAVGVDHLIYGWLFFGLVIVAMFLVGNRFRDAAVIPPAPESISLASKLPSMICMMIVVTSLTLATYLLANLRMSTQPTARGAVALAMNDVIGDWSALEDSSGNWKPNFSGAASERLVKLQTVDREAYAYLATPTGDTELVNPENRVYDNSIWYLRDQKTFQSNGFRVTRSELFSPRLNQELLAFSWYQIGNKVISNSAYAKFLVSLEQLKGSQIRPLFIAVAVPYELIAVESEEIFGDLVSNGLYTATACASSNQYCAESL